MIRYISSPLDPPAAPRLFSINQIALLSFFTGFPVGFAMAYVNLKRIGSLRSARRLILGLAAATLALLLLMAFLPVPSTVYSLPFNVLCIAYLNVAMTRELLAYRSRGGQYADEKIWNGCGMGLLGLLAWIVLAGALLASLHSVSQALNLRPPSLGI
ncbi:MAG: hypothetical protein ACOY0R_09480 [Chloroflexota bacterium]